MIKIVMEVDLRGSVSDYPSIENDAESVASDMVKHLLNYDVINISVGVIALED